MPDPIKSITEDTPAKTGHKDVDFLDDQRRRSKYAIYRTPAIFGVIIAVIQIIIAITAISVVSASAISKPVGNMYIMMVVLNAINVIAIGLLYVGWRQMLRKALVTFLVLNTAWIIIMIAYLIYVPSFAARQCARQYANATK